MQNSRELRVFILYSKSDENALKEPVRQQKWQYREV